MTINHIPRIILQKLSSSQATHDLLQQLELNQIARASSLPLSAQAFLMASLLESGSEPALCIFETTKEAQQFYQDLEELAPEAELHYFPAFEREMWNEVGPSGRIVGHRLVALKSLLSEKAKIIVTSAPALLEKVADPRVVEEKSIRVKSEGFVDFEGFIEALVKMGFVREDRVDRPGELSVRGGLIDIYLLEAANPVRIEFFGDQVESIREFDVESQRSLDHLNELEIVPLGSAGPYAPFDEHTEYDVRYTHTLLDYLSESTRLFIRHPQLVDAALELYQEMVSARFESFAEEHKLENLEYLEFFSSQKLVNERLDAFSRVEIGAFSDRQQSVDFGFFENAHFGGKLDLFKKQVTDELAQNNDTLIALMTDSEAQQHRMKELLQQEGFPQDIHLDVLSLSAGFYWPEQRIHLFTNREIYSRIRLARLDKIDKRSISLRQLSAINIGDFVVHNDYGIGIFRGLEKVKAYNKERECLKLEYQDRDIVYVPLEKMDQVQKYSSRDGVVPVLNKLGSPVWERLKSKTKNRVKEIAEQLIKLYATRHMRPGFAFGEDTIWQKELEASFKFVETDDQVQAIAEIKQDMQKSRPMDRLICGDVGYGKTEVAVRAAFKAINDGKQVAVLVPTTILAQQHYETFVDRMQNFPVNIRLLSRFKTAAQQKESIQKLKEGKVDLIIGTHRLLSNDVEFKDVGLLVVDEEQRFGVMHKEKLKMLKASVDTLTLSATPIPRTMHMALMGAKDMSLINTPPSNRLPIKTEVSRFDRDLIREAILKEVDRGGQVFFVHNRVQSIYGMADLVRDIVPEVKIAVAHGQMKGHELEKVMHAFAGKKIHVLICTMIIESGIDLPNVNTLIINRADKFGLGQLYQLRGRVGRSDQQAFAYLLIPPMRKLTRDAIKRLQTIQEYSNLGAGYKIAMRDLEIRGTGNIFGAKQTGFADALGYDLYNKIIEESIKELRVELDLDTPTVEEQPAPNSRVDLDVDAFFPDDYVTSASERVDLYRRLVDAGSLEQVTELQDELQDRFGAIPQEAQNLVDYVMLKHLASKARLSKLSVRDGKMIGQFDPEFVPSGEQFRPWLGKIVSQAGDQFQIKDASEGLTFEMALGVDNKQLEVVKKFLQKI